MSKRDELIADFHARAREQVHLAVVAQAEQVRAMHLELAIFREEQAQVAEVVCKDD